MIDAQSEANVCSPIYGGLMLGQKGHFLSNTFLRKIRISALKGNGVGDRQAK